MDYKNTDQKKSFLQALPRKHDGTNPRHFITRPFSEYSSLNHDQPRRLCFEKRVAVITGPAAGSALVQFFILKYVFVILV